MLACSLAMVRSSSATDSPLRSHWVLVRTKSSDSFSSFLSKPSSSVPISCRGHNPNLPSL